MLELAYWGGLGYYMFKEEGPNNHIVLVKNEQEKEAFFKLENGDQLSSELSYDDSTEARRMIREFREEFLRYWNKRKKVIGK